jgi:hypothetical protein
LLLLLSSSAPLSLVWGGRTLDDPPVVLGDGCRRCCGCFWVFGLAAAATDDDADAAEDGAAPPVEGLAVVDDAVVVMEARTLAGASMITPFLLLMVNVFGLSSE